MEGVTCCLIAPALFYFGWKRGREAAALESATRVNHLMYLEQLLGTGSEVLPFIVAISGRVGSDTPISCQYSDLRGVIVEETAEQHYLEHNSCYGSEPFSFVTRDSSVMTSKCNEVLWYLDDGTGRAFVVGARDAKGFFLTLGGEVFEEANTSAGCSRGGVFSHGSGLLGLGVKRVERVLPVGTLLTVVGEAFKDHVGTIRVRQPSNGPFYISNKRIDQLIYDLDGIGW